MIAVSATLRLEAEQPSTDDLVRTVHEPINEYRREQGLQPLTLNPTLARPA